MWINDRNRRLGFTITEVMIAMAVTLLMMGALARMFKTIGTRMQASRSNIELSSRLRSTSFRLRDDLRHMTVRATGAEAGGGYFLYYEGPFADASTLAHGRRYTDEQQFLEGTGNGAGDPVTSLYWPDSRYGDFDDMIAFTAEAPDGQWFTGKVPFYLTVDMSLPAYQNLSATERMRPVVTTAKRAEIVIWSSPEWLRDSFGNPIYDATGSPMYIDRNGDLLPDRIVLRRRVLLIREDFNTLINVRPFLLNTNGPARQAKVLRAPRGGAVTVASSWTDYRGNGSLSTAANIVPSQWMTGLADVQQLYDLSLRRLVDPETGQLTNLVAANSLKDLDQPHNRFAHVRIPGEYFGFGRDQVTTMPVLALSGQRAYNPTAQPPGAPNPITRSFFSSGDNPAYVGSFPVPTWQGTFGSSSLLNGFLLPQFELNQPSQALINTLQPGAPNPDSRWMRRDEDVVASGVLSMDLKAYDPLAANVMAAGPDNAPGNIGIDDDSNGTVDDLSELGAPSSDDLPITHDDPGIYTLILATTVAGAGGGGGTVRPLQSGYTGGFVDLGYPLQTGSAWRDLWTQHRDDSQQLRNVIDSAAASMMSVYTPPTTSTNFVQDLFNATPDPLMRSGRSLFRNLGGANQVLRQVAYETWTDYYESDGFNQGHARFGGNPANPIAGTWWILNNAAGVPVIPESELWASSGGSFGGTGSVLDIDEGSDGIDQRGSATGVDDYSERESVAPIGAPLGAVQLRLRVEDPATNQVRQLSMMETVIP